MSGPQSFSIEKLSKLVGTPSAPVLIDIRIPEDFALDPCLIPASRKGSHLIDIATLLDPTDELVVIVCQRGAKLSHGLAALFRLQGYNAVSLTGGFEAWRAAGLPAIPHAILPTTTTTGKTRWVTRHRPKIDRIACPWLIKRFVDPQAEFLFVPPEHVEGVADRFAAMPFDMPTGFWTHEGDRCTFDKMLNAFNLETKPLLHLARIVRAADTSQLHDAPEAAGLLAISLGLSRQYSDDIDQLAAGMSIYDALYRWCRDATDESHSWTPAKVPES